MTDFFTRCFDWPTLPMTVGVLICCGYWLLVILGLLDLDTFDLDLDIDVEPSFAGTGIGFLSLRFLNLGNVPLMLWLSVFTLSGWLISMWIDQLPRSDVLADLAVAVGRNCGLALVATKLLTNPMRGRFDPQQPNRVEELLGRIGTVASREVTEKHGQVRVDAEAAPLLLNVRSRSETLKKNESAVLVDYLPEQRVYLVERAPDKESSHVL